MNEGLYNDGARYYERIGREYYFPPLQEYIENLTDFLYYEEPFPKRFGNRGELIALTRRFVAMMFGAPALAADKKFWVEKIPMNMIAMDFLWELFPEATIIHIKRDPRGVLFCYLQQNFQSYEWQQAAKYSGYIYWQWSKIKPKLDLHRRRYLEIKLGDLVVSPKKIMGDIAKIMGDIANVVEIRYNFELNYLIPTMVGRWRTEMPTEWQKYAEKHLEPYFQLMGYDLIESSA